MMETGAFWRFCVVGEYLRHTSNLIVILLFNSTYNNLFLEKIYNLLAIDLIDWSQFSITIYKVVHQIMIVIRSIPYEF